MINSFVRPTDLKVMRHKHVEIVDEGTEPGQKMLKLDPSITKEHDGVTATMRRAVDTYKRQIERKTDTLRITKAMPRDEARKGMMDHFILSQGATPFCTDSAIGRDVTRVILNARDELYIPNKFDQVSHSVLANHNVYVMLNTFERANWIAANKPNALPPQVINTIQLIRRELGA